MGYREKDLMPYQQQVVYYNEEIFKNKKFNDLVYGYIRLHSFFISNQNEIDTYCYKSEITAKKILDYYDKEVKKPFPYKIETVREYVKIWLNCDWIEETKYNKIKAYKFKNPTTEQYILIQLNTLKYLVNTAMPNIIKVYIYLKNKYQQHLWIKKNKDSKIEKFSFSRKSLLNAIGYSFDGGESRKRNRKMIEDILNCLSDNGLIKIHEHWETINNNIHTKYFILDKVNDECKKDLNIITESQTPDHNQDSASKKEKKKSLIYVNGYVIKPSKGEEKIKEILESNNIKFEREKSFPTCGKGMFRFDFYLPNINTCIEYDGEQHFRPIEYFGGEDAFNKQVTYDNIKNEWCKKQGINLIRIPYTDYDKIDISYIIQRLNL